MTQLQTRNDHGRLTELLPWYVNGTLEDSEREAVRQHVDACEECRENVKMLSQVQHSVRNSSTAPLVPAPSKDQLLSALDQAPGKLHSPKWRWYAMAASVAAVAVVAAILYSAMQPDNSTPARFETVTSSAGQQSINYVVELQVAPGVAPVSRDALFESLQAGDSVVALGENSYRVTLGLGALSLSELDQFVENLESRQEIKSANVVAVQLPVE